MSDSLVDTELPGPGGLGLTPAERQALGADTSPDATIAEHLKQTENEQASVERYELERMRQENEQMRSQLGDTTTRLNEVATNNANLNGQLSAWQAQQQAAAEAAQADARYALTPEEMESHGEMLPVMEKLLAKQRFEQEREFQQRLTAAEAQWKADATGPLQQELQTVKQDAEARRQRDQSTFQANLVNEVSTLGFGDINTLVAMPEFQARYGQPAAPGVPTAWGDLLKEHIVNQNLAEASAMLRSFAGTVERVQPREDNEGVPGRGAQRPMSPDQSSKLKEREQLTLIYQQRMEDANVGKFPPGMDRNAYRKAQAELRSKIDAIPVT